MSIRLINGKIGKSVNRDVDPFAELIAVAIENDKSILLNSQFLACLNLVARLELPGGHTMGNNTDRLLDPTFNKFVRPEFGVGHHCIPCVGGISEAADPVVGVHRHVPNELKAQLLVQIMNTSVLLVDNPAVVDGKDDIRLLNLNDLADAVLPKSTVLESVGCRVNLVSLLQRIRIPMPVAA